MRYPQLEVRDVERILRNLGFEKQAQKSTSHVFWKKILILKDGTGHSLNVCVDPPKAPFSRTLIRYMCHQAGVSKKTWYEALDKKFKAPPDDKMHTADLFESDS